ncbi:MAG: 50S ribosomal protein L20 [Mycoplasmataceae bacterium]|jgi:large subunit ribosomal protein L20|nr:50S ribosomal protein L20 [Mycoplasmataceae bacterium]
MRVTNGPITRRRRKAVKKAVEGAVGIKHFSYKHAKQTLIRAKVFAYRDRKNKKRDFRKLWISRINVAVRALGYNYSTFVNKLNKSNVKLNRKMISELAINNPQEFENLVNSIMKN